MEQASVPRRGPIEGSSRVLRELLRTPRFKKTVRILLSELDPENAGLLVRTLMWEDPEFFLSLFGALPDVVNVGFEGARELSSQLGNFPPGLLASFLSAFLERVEFESLGRAMANTVDLLADVREAGGSDFTDSLSDAVRRFARGARKAPAAPGAPPVTVSVIVDNLLPALGSLAAAAGKEAQREGSEVREAVARLARGIREIAAENPEFVNSVVSPLVEAGRQALADAQPREGS